MFILVATRLLEVFDLVPVYPIAQWIIDLEKETYWLPVSEALGVDGRWPGPFGFNSKTGFISTLLVLIGVARWSPSSLAFVPIGLLGILLTGGRGAALALAAGLLVLVVFAQRGPVSRVPLVARATIGAASVVAFGLYFFLSPTATTGRLGDGGIWQDFTDLWATSPWLGVGQTGILADPRTAGTMEAHNLYIQELTRSGVVGFAFQFTVIGLGLALAAIAAYRGLAWPLALLTAYYVASMTEVFQDGWLTHSTYSLLIILCVTASAQWLSDRAEHPNRIASEPGTAGESARTPAAP